MKLPRRKFLHLAAGAAALPFAPHVARAQAYPTRPVRIIVGFPAGGGADIVARLIGQWLSERLGQQFIIENRPGAGTNIATEAVVRAVADGYTLLLVHAANAMNATLYEKLNFNFIRDIAPVAGIIVVPNFMVVNPSVSAKTVPELIAYAQANPGKINIASGPIGAPAHVAAELFKMMTGTEMLLVSYRGVAPALTDLLGGQVQVMFVTTVSSIEYIKTGRLRALAVTTATRSETLPDIPAMGEFVPGYEATSWYGVGVPRNTPAEIVQQLNKEVNAALADPKMKVRLADLGEALPESFGKRTAFITKATAWPSTAVYFKRNATPASRRSLPSTGCVLRPLVSMANQFVIAGRLRLTLSTASTTPCLLMAAHSSRCATTLSIGARGPAGKLLAAAGKDGRDGAIGPRGERGERGLIGPRGEPAPTITGWRIDRAAYAAVPLLSDGSEGAPLELRDLFKQFLDEVAPRR